MMQAEKRDFELACVAMLGALAKLQARARQMLDAPETCNQLVGALPPRSIEIQTQQLTRQVESLYEALFECRGRDAETDAELHRLGLAPPRAEDFDHMPPFRGKPQ